MVVLHVINQLSDHGGAEVSLELMLSRLEHAGVHNVVLPLKDDRGASAAGRLRAHGVDVLPHVRGRGLARIRAVRRQIASAEPDLVHTSLFEADLHGRLAGRSLGVPTLVSLVNMQYSAAARAALPTPWKLDVVLLVDRLLGRFATTHFHALTEAVAEHAVDRLKVPRQAITVVPRGRAAAALDASSAQERAVVRARLCLPLDRPIVLNVARQEPQKGQVHLVRAMADVRRAVPDVLLLVAGREGTASQAVQQEIDGAGLGDSVCLMGARSDVPDLLCAADIFAFASRWEGMGGAVLEAMAAGLPVVAFDIAPVREILGGHGRLVPSGDEAALADALAADLLDPEGARVRAELGRERFAAEYGIDAVIPRMADLYRSVAGGMSRRAPWGP